MRGPGATLEKAAKVDGKMQDLIQNHYMRDYVRQRQDQERETFLDGKISAVKPIFKNFVDNNTNIMRTEARRSMM